MQNIPFDFVPSWQNNGTIRSPAAIRTVCPHCGDKVIFTLTHQQNDQVRRATAATATCPGCQGLVQFWALRSKASPQNPEDNPTAIYMYPASKSYPTPNLTDDVPEALRRSFVSTIDAFNSSNYAATAVCGRRTLEGIFKYLVPEDKRKQINLAALIELATAEVDLAAPLRTLSHAIRDGGNLGAHFDAEKEPTELLAKQMVELLDYLISYLYVLPEMIKKLEQSLGRED